MKKFLFVLISICLLQTACYALDVVYPTSLNPKISSPSTFFVGSVNIGEKLFQNGQEIYVHRTGAFAQAVKLLPGRNQFVLTSGDVSKTYIIERPNLNKTFEPAKYIEFEKPSVVEVKREGAPLRSTSIQEGINRISHFQKGIELKAIGELGDMYKVEL